MCYKYRETNEKYTQKRMKEKDIGFGKKQKDTNGRETK